MVRTAVVGAGISGLATTHALRARGVEVATFERSERPGGVIRSERVDGALLEYGPQRLRLAGPLVDLVDELGLDGSLRYAPEDAPLFVLANGEFGKVPRSIPGLIRTDLLSARGKLRILAEPLARQSQPGESAGELLTRKFGQEAYRHVIEPLLGGIYASDPARMPVEHALSPILDMERRHRSLLVAGLRRMRGRTSEAPVISFDEGLAALPRALHAANRDRVHLACPVERVEVHDSNTYRVVHTEGTVTVDRVILTTPAWETAGLLADLPEARVGGLRDLRYNPLALVHLRADVDAHGMGYQVRRDEPVETLGVTWNDALFGRDGVYTAFLGGMWDPEIVDRDPTVIGQTARQEFERYMGTTAEILDVTVLERAIPAYDGSWRHLADVSLPDGVDLVTNYTGRIGVTGRLREATGVAEAVASGTQTGNDF